EGGEIGTILEVTDSYVVVDTGKHQATLPPNAVAPGENGPVMGMTKAELDATMDQMAAEAEAKLAAALVPGATLFGINGARVGTIKSVGDDGTVVFTHEVGDVPLTRDQFTTTDAGLSLAFSAQQLEQALAPRRELQAKV